jgi:hypothetical protein
VEEEAPVLEVEEKNKALVRRLLEAHAKGDLDALEEMLASPEVALEGVENARRHYTAVLTVYDDAPDTTVSRFDAGWLLEKAPYYAVEAVTFEQEQRDGIPEDERTSEDEIREWASFLEERLWERLEGKDTFTVGELRGQLECRRQDGLYAPGGSAREAPYHRPPYARQSEKQARKVEVGRYEAHLSRELYRALHELEALQTRRTGGATPLGRVDVQS